MLLLQGGKPLGLRLVVGYNDLLLLEQRVAAVLCFHYFLLQIGHTKRPKKICPGGFLDVSDSFGRRDCFDQSVSVILSSNDGKRHQLLKSRSLPMATHTLVQIFLPLYDNEGNPFPQTDYKSLQTLLT